MIKEVSVVSIFLLNILTLVYLVTKRKFIQGRIGRFKLSFESYCVGVLLGPLLLLLFKLLTPNEIVLSLTKNGTSDPLGILILFLSMALLSIYLDLAGVIEYCARVALKISGNSGRKLFFAFYALVSILTIFTSNDIIILTLTPFIYYFAKYSKIDPKPFLFAEFFAANTWSMMLQIGNPTNIFITTVYGIKFLEYFQWMLLPTIIGGIVNCAVIYWIFHKKIPTKINPVHPEPKEAIKDNFAALVGTIILIVCLIVLCVGPYLNWEMWKISLGFAMIIILLEIVRKIFKRSKIKFSEIFSRIPWSVIPFVLSFFIVVYSLNKYNITSYFGNMISTFFLSNSSLVWSYGILSALSANIMNNIPMSVAFTSVMQNLSGSALNAAAYASVVGSNLGAIITPIGALAGIMWMSILKKKKYRISFREFIYYGSITAAATLVSTLLILGLEFYWFG